MREKYQKEGFSPDQIDEIEIGLQKGLKVSHYAKKEFLAIQMHQIRLGLEEKLPVAKYANPEYDWFQMEEIREGLKKKLDVSKYADPKLSYEVMREVRKGLERGIELPANRGWSAGILREVRRAALAKVNIIKYIKEGYREEQLREIRKAMENGINVEPYISIDFNGAGIHEIVKGLETKVDVSIYTKDKYNWQQMREIRLGLKDRVQTEYYVNPLYNWKQMREIRLGLEEGLPVEQYATLMFTAKEMAKKRNALLKIYTKQEVKETEENKEIEEILRIVEARETAETQGTEFVEKSVENGEKLDFTINVSRDEMQAMIVFNTSNRKLDKETLYTHLFKAGVVSGIDEAAVNILLKGSYMENTIIIANGIQPQQGKDGYYEFFFRTEVSKKPVILEDGTVDYKNIDWMESVKKEQKIAYYHSAEEGAEGKTVTGKILPPRKGKELKMLSGRGFELLPDRKTYISAMDGKIEFENDKIMITDLLQLDDVTISTGNIQFDGSIHVRGNVGKGVSITATKDITVDGFVEAANLSAQGDIILKKGCNASGQGQITCGKDLMARFLEGARIHAEGSVKINYCMNCDIHAENTIEVTGMIAGGTSYAGAKISARDIGNYNGLRTVVKAGQSEEFIKQEAQLKGKIYGAEEELKLLQRAFDDFQKFPVEVRNTNPVYLKLEDAIYTKKTEVEKMLETKEGMDKSKERFENASIVVKGTIYEGSLVEISGVPWRAKTSNYVTLRKDGARISVT